jgi:hypothetical protein
VEDEGSQSQASIFSGFLTFLGSICLLEDSSMHGIVREVSDQRSQVRPPTILDREVQLSVKPANNFRLINLINLVLSIPWA